MACVVDIENETHLEIISRKNSPCRTIFDWLLIIWDNLTDYVWLMKIDSITENWNSSIIRHYATWWSKSIKLLHGDEFLIMVILDHKFQMFLQLIARKVLNQYNSWAVLSLDVVKCIKYITYHWIDENVQIQLQKKWNDFYIFFHSLLFIVITIVIIICSNWSILFVRMLQKF